MARRINPQPASQQSLNALTGKMDQVIERLDGFASKDDLKDLKATVLRVAADFDLRLAKTATQESVNAVKSRLDGHVASMDRAAGELLDARRSLLVFDSMLGDHRRRLDSHDQRLTVLESRQPAP